jgi:hypothetical protein
MSARPARGLDLPKLNRLVWFGVLGGPIAWAVQFLLGMQLNLARCESPNARFPLPASAWAVALASVAVLVAALAELAAIAVLRATRSDDEGSRGQTVAEGRLHFLAAVGITVNPLVLAICVMVGVGVPVLGLCHQS